MFLHLGNSHSETEVPDDLDAWFGLYSRALDSFTQAELYRDVPLVYTWNDTDSGGEAAHAAYRTYIPHYPLPADSPDAPEDELRPISQAFSATWPGRSAQTEMKWWTNSSPSIGNGASTTS